MSGRATRGVKVVDAALDKYLATFKTTRDLDPEGFFARTLAHIARVSTPTMSRYLQEHREAGGGRYVVGCEQYGPKNARWRILSKPGSDPKAVRKARVDHTVWVAQDAAKRLVKDISKEIAPALHDTAWDQVIEDETQALQDQVALAVRRVERAMARLNGGSP